MAVATISSAFRATTATPLAITFGGAIQVPPDLTRGLSARPTQRSRMPSASARRRQPDGVSHRRAAALAQPRGACVARELAVSFGALEQLRWCGPRK